MNITVEGRTFVFGELAEQDEAERLVRALLDAEQKLAEKQAGGNEELIAQATRGVMFAEGDVSMYAAWSQPDSRFRRSVRDEPEEASPLTAGERAIVAELREIRRAVLADRMMIQDELGELTKSRAVISNEGEQS